MGNTVANATDQMVSSMCLYLCPTNHTDDIVWSYWKDLPINY